MRRFSQWDWSALAYRYYEGEEAADPGGYQKLRGVRQEVPPRNDGGDLGVSLDQVLRPLPPGVRFIGVGTQAVGEVVRSTRGAPAAGTRRVGAHTPRPGVAGGDIALDPLLASVATAGGGTKTHPGITVEALDHPPFALAVTAGLAMGFGLGRAFGSGGRVFAWIVGGLFGLAAAGARRKAFLQLTNGSKTK